MIPGQGIGGMEGGQIMSPSVNSISRCGGDVIHLTLRIARFSKSRDINSSHAHCHPRYPAHNGGVHLQTPIFVPRAEKTCDKIRRLPKTECRQ